ncbi:MAG: T9SS type A sorting domain-containing protein [Bacteroidota bacterium]
MKKQYIFLIVLALLLKSFSHAQEQPGFSPLSLSEALNDNIPLIVITAHDFTKDIADAEVFQKQGNYPRFARSFDLNLSLSNSGNWSTLSNGDRVWRLHLKSNGAIAISLYFEDFFLPEGSTLHVYTPEYKQVSGSYTYLDNQGNELFSTEFLSGEEQIIEYFEPLSAKGQGKLRIASLAHQYRTLAMAEDCEVNINCSPEGTNWQDEKKGVVRIIVKEGTQLGYCSGTLINNTALDCKRYILTAFHCGTTASAADFNGWKFYFNYEAPLCSQGDDIGISNNVFTGCVKKAGSEDNGGSTGSDFLLVQMNATTRPSWWTTVYWNGWSRSTSAPASGSICIHHPAGSNKKISTTTGLSTTSTWGGSVLGTHWRVFWTGTTNGWGVTEGGSSGSPLFNTNSQVVGTLTGGGSYCNSVQPNGQTQADAFGKLSYHWTSNGTTSIRQLKPWLDPINSGVTSLNGGFNPCNGVGIQEVTETEVVTSIYPNPSNGRFTLSVNSGIKEEVEITTYNFAGQAVMSNRMESSPDGKFILDLTGQPDGLYLIHIKTPAYTQTKSLMLFQNK